MKKCAYILEADVEALEYEVILGNEKIVFIKAGANGTVSGCKNKYYRMAQRLHERLGATVICASNPDTPHRELDEQKIRQTIHDRGFSDFEIYFIGNSDGAYHNLLLAKRFPEAVKLVGINSSYITAPDLQEKLQDLPNVSKVLVYGTNDDDFDRVVPALEKTVCNNLSLKYVEGADHDFTGMLEEFIGTAEYLCD